jgi:predicted nucleic acid-binding Zn ribbon protein
MHTNGDRYCVSCGTQKGFTSASAVKCEACTEIAKKKRARYQREYQAARTRAASSLIRKHHDEFMDLLHDETAQSDYLREVSIAGSPP